MLSNNRLSKEAAEAISQIRNMTDEQIEQAWHDAQNSMFEYHIFCGGTVWRIGRVRHEDAYPMVEEWVSRQHPDKDGEPIWKTHPIFVFSECRLSSILELMELSTCPTLDQKQQWQAVFFETVFPLCVPTAGTEEPEPRIFTWS